MVFYQGHIESRNQFSYMVISVFELKYLIQGQINSELTRLSLLCLIYEHAKLR
jgi:hypothetical protein